MIQLESIRRVSNAKSNCYNVNALFSRSTVLFLDGDDESFIQADHLVVCSLAHDSYLFNAVAAEPHLIFSRGRSASFGF